MFACAMGLAFANYTVTETKAATAAGLWPVQGFLFFFALLLGDSVAQGVYRNTAVVKGDVKEVPAVKSLIALVLGGLLLSSPAMAQFTQPSPPPLSFQRVGIGLGAGANLYDADAIDILGQGHGLVGYGALSYSLGKQVSIGTSYEWDFDNEFGVWGFGPRLLLIGDGQGQYTQLAVGFDGLKYQETAEGYVEDDFSYGAVVAASYNLAGKPGKPVRWYVTGKGTSDLKNDRTWLGLGLLISEGGAPVT